MNSSEVQASQSTNSDIDLIMSLYDAREKMPMQAEPSEGQQDDREKTTGQS